MPTYGNYCPVSMAAEVVADRWTPLIIRELVFGNTRFNDIARAMPGISRSLLVQRLRHLERRGVLDTWPSPTGRGSEYHLTPAGRDLERVIDSLGRWAIEWLFDEIRPQDVSASTLMWWMHRRIDHDRLPSVRTVIEFRHTAPESISTWLVIEGGDASVCMQDPGLQVDVEVVATTPALADVFQGYCTWAEALEAGRMAVAGPPGLTGALPGWFLWSPWAQATRERADRAAAKKTATQPEKAGPVATTAAATVAVAAAAAFNLTDGESDGSA
ncbi:MULTISPECIES: winged helix-turn-helix transcriptional regulator [Nocardioides]|uniref:Winged helix-turn-helix transcriptional regulator n=1 Tax=Nocardioides vastitatis TaxID=2568655 RepID=A0ABW0ZCA2_9ACTN|nr:helix-turn-helix domain-containing protein [Nocardioides sp.]THI96535.1 helix-turn-helix transcriptional regulator [Nocardioides sp.]